MELITSHTQTLPINGQYPSSVHFPDNTITTFYYDGTNLKSITSINYFTADIDWSNVEFNLPEIIAEETGIVNFKLKSLSDLGTYGSWTQDLGVEQSFIVYRSVVEVSKWLKDGIINLVNNNQEFELSATLSDFQNNEEFEEVIANSTSQSKISIKFTMPDNSEKVLGVYYLYNRTGENSEIDLMAENFLQLVLNEQSLGINNVFSLDTLSNNLKKILDISNVPNYTLDNSGAVQYQGTFIPNTKNLHALKEIIMTNPDWKIIEKLDGQIAIGNRQFYLPLQINTTHGFNFDVGQTSASKIENSIGNYSQICVHNKDFSISNYQTLDNSQSLSNKIYFYEASMGATQIDIDNIAMSIKNNYSEMVKFVEIHMPFSPQIIVEDYVEVYEQGVLIGKGLVSEVKHNLIKHNYTTTLLLEQSE